MRTLEQALIFTLDESLYSINGNRIDHILRVPELTPIPLMNNSIRGLCSLGGNIVPVIDLLTILTGKKQTDTTNPKARILTVSYENFDYAFLVEEVKNAVSTDNCDIEFNDNPDDVVEAIMKTGDDLIQMLGVDSLFQKIEIPRIVAEDVRESLHKEGVLQIHEENTTKFLIFTMGKERFAINIADIREIIFVPDEITPTVEAEPAELGMITLRNEVVSAIDLRKSFGVNGITDDKNRILIAEKEGKPLGLLVDSILEVHGIDNNQIEHIPDSFADKKISGVTRRENQLVSVVNENYVHDLVDHFSTLSEGKKTIQSVDATVEAHNTVEVVVFSLGKEEYAFDIEEIEEIIRFTPITAVPESNRYLKGVINLRGAIIPVVSLQERLGFTESINDNTKMLVCRVEDNRIGFLVDDVSEVLFVESQFVSKSLDTEAIFSHIINLSDGSRIIMKLSLEKIFDAGEWKNVFHTAQD